MSSNSLETPVEVKHVRTLWDECKLNVFNVVVNGAAMGLGVAVTMEEFHQRNIILFGVTAALTCCSAVFTASGVNMLAHYLKGYKAPEANNG